MPYNVASESFHTQKVYSRLSSRGIQFYSKKTLCIFSPIWGVMGNMRCSLGLTEKPMVDFLLVIT